MTHFARLGILGAVLTLMPPGVAMAQTAKLLNIKTVFIVPNAYERETAQFEEKIPAELGWQIVYERSAADAIWVYDQYELPLKTIYTDTPPVSSTRTIYAVKKSVEIHTNDGEDDLLWKTETMGFPRIAGTAIKRLKKRMERMRRVLASQSTP